MKHKPLLPALLGMILAASLLAFTILFYAVVYVLLNFCADLLYAVLNPKVRL